jgi:hypothetical protein
VLLTNITTTGRGINKITTDNAQHAMQGNAQILIGVLFENWNRTGYTKN